MNKFTLQEISKIKRSRLGNSVPLEVFRMLRLIGIRGTLPMGGKSITAVVGREIGKSLGCRTLEEFSSLLIKYKLGFPEIIENTPNKIVIQLHDCLVCAGMDNIGEKGCDLEGAIIEGALSSILQRPVTVRETKCNLNGDGVCEFECILR